MDPMSPRAADVFLDVSGILEPASIAVIGASERPGNLGGDTVRRLVKFGFPGPVWPVNRSAAPVAGLPSFSTVARLPGVPHLAVLAVPAEALLDAVRECAAAGVRYGVAYAGGLGEAGGAGAELQRALVALCRATGFTLCGPNCVGVINATIPATPTFSTALLEVDALRPGGISIVAQSGGIGTTAFSLIQQAGFGCRHMISSGNEAVVGYADYLYALARDEGTHVIAGYLEGTADSDRLVRALEEARRCRKPVVLIKAGATSASARAAQAHTGALVGEDRVVDAVLRELGVIRVQSIEELVDVSLLLAGNRARLPAGRGVGVVTFGGGNGVLAVDQCAQFGLSTPALSAACVERLRPLLISVATAANPLDLTPTTAFRAESLALLPQALDAVTAEPEIHTILFIAGSLAAKGAEISDVIASFATRAAKPVCVSWPSPPLGIPERLATRGIYAFLDPVRGIQAVARLATQGDAAARPPRPPGPRADGLTAFDWGAHVADPRGHLVVPEDRCHRLLAAAGLPVAAAQLVQGEAAARGAAEAIGYPVVVKGISPSVTHRAAAGLLAVDLRSGAEVAAACRGLEARAGEIGTVLDGIYVQRMHRGGTELLLAAFRDPMFGVMVSCGSGGALTELIDDVVTERAPVDRPLAVAMLDRLRIRRHAVDLRGPLDAGPAADFLVRFSELALTAPWRRFVFEVNPLKWTRDGVVAVDGLLIIDAD
jgi:acyl-CoA synthetase (NDP forming)